MRGMMNKDSWFSDYDIHLLAEGTHYRSFELLGAHLAQRGTQHGTQFSVWAPNARRVSVVGDFNNWDESAHPLEVIPDLGIWTGFIPGVTQGTAYKYSIYSNYHGHVTLKSDPHALYSEVTPKSASVVWNIDDYQWGDSDWMTHRASSQALDRPMSIYEVHLGSWMRKPEEGGRWLSYREMADRLCAYVSEMGFTHVEFLPLTEHPLTASWGYQPTGFFAATSRYGTPQDLMYLIDRLHQHRIGVLMDWVPGHFPTDGHGLAMFDGTCLYEHEDNRKGYHPDWGTLIFNYGRREVANFLISSAVFWLDKYHVDGLRVDAVASMLYLDYSRREGEWIPNQYGGRENLEAIAFIRKMNEVVYERFPSACMIAEESTAWPMVSRPTSFGGLGFGYKWNMGWMHDTLSYMSKESIHRSYHHNSLSFGMLYSYHENFILPLSHDEVVHGKGSLVSKMPGDDWQRFANLRALFGYMWGYPGKKLLFMGGEFAQWNEWYSETSLDWHLLQSPLHQGIQSWVRDLNAVYHREPSLWQIDFDWTGFQWVECHDYLQSVLSFLRFSRNRESVMLVVLNFTPVPRRGYRLGVPEGGYWEEVLNSDSHFYGGSGIGNSGGVSAEEIPAHGFQYSVSVDLPPLGALYLRRAG